MTGRKTDETAALIARMTDAEAPPAGRHQAFREIVRLFQDLAFGYAYALLGDFHLAEDAAQEAFLAAWQELPRLHDPAAFPGWFKRIVLSQCHRLTRRKRLNTVPLDAARDLASGDDPALLAEQGALRYSVRVAIQSLPENERVATTLFYIGEYSYSDIAAFLDVPVSTIKKRLYTARTRLRERMTDMVKDMLQEQRPSNEDRLTTLVQFHTALKEGDTQTAARLLDSDQALIESTFTDGYGIAAQPPLTVAIGSDQRAVVELLITRGAAVTERDVHDAAWTGKREIARLLVAAGGIDATVASPGPDTVAFFRAVHGGDLAMVEEALQTRADLAQARDKAGCTALHIAAAYGYEDVARLLLRHGAEAAAQDTQGKTPLQHAAANANWCGQGQPEVMELLAEHGAAYDIFTVSGAGILTLVEKMLAARPELLNVQDANGETPMERAISGFSKGRSAVVEFLLPKDPEMNIWMASQFGRIERVRDLLQQDPSLATRRRSPTNPKTPLHCAAQNWCPQEQAAAIVELLALHGADVNDQQGDFGWAPLHMVAEWWNDTQIAAALLKHGATINALSAQGWTPLKYALALGREEMAEFLRQRGASE